MFSRQIVSRLPILQVNLRHFSSGGAVKKPFFRRIWESWIPIPTGVGITLLGVLQLRRMDKERRKEEEHWEVKMYKKLPLRGLSRGAGKIAEMPIPEVLRTPLFATYAKFFNVDVSEMSDSYGNFHCFADFFTRPLRDGCRPISNSAIISPADGRVLNSSKIESFKLEQIKGVTYQIQEFLGKITWKKFALAEMSYKKLDWDSYKSKIVMNPKNELYQCIIYLAPGDYHRFHSPADINVEFRRHFPGYLMSVSPRIASLLPGLFSLNERVVYTGTWTHGFFSFTAVGATNVGSIRVYKDTALTTNNRPIEKEPVDLDVDFEWKKGEEVGEFRIGSTVVLIFEAPPDFEMDFEPNTRIKVGNGLSSNY